MKITVAKDYEALSREAAHAVIEQVRGKRDSVLVFPGGDTPAGMLRELIEASHSQHVDFSDCTFVSLDEWVGLDGSVEGSCRYTLDRLFFKPAPIAPSQILFFDAKAANLQAECRRMDERIAAAGGVDLLVLGIGLNGHIGFNEPGASWDSLCHVAELDDITKSVASKYFPNGTDHVHQGITIGMRHIMESKRVVVLANGEKKTEIVKKVVHDTGTPAVPASMLKDHPHCSIIVDEACWNGN